MKGNEPMNKPDINPKTESEILSSDEQEWEKCVANEAEAVAEMYQPEETYHEPWEAWF